MGLPFTSGQLEGASDGKISEARAVLAFRFFADIWDLGSLQFRVYGCGGARGGRARWKVAAGTSRKALNSQKSHPN